MGEQEFSKCDICGQETHVCRKYYYCEPKPPRLITLSLGAMAEKV